MTQTLAPEYPHLSPTEDQKALALAHLEAKRKDLKFKGDAPVLDQIIGDLRKMKIGLCGGLHDRPGQVLPWNCLTRDHALDCLHGGEFVGNNDEQFFSYGASLRLQKYLDAAKDIQNITKLPFKIDPVLPPPRFLDDQEHYDFLDQGPDIIRLQDKINAADRKRNKTDLKSVEWHAGLVQPYGQGNKRTPLPLAETTQRVAGEQYEFGTELMNVRGRLLELYESLK